MAIILVIDDDVDLLGLITHQIREAGHQVIAQADSQQAYDTLETTPVDLILTDLEMPEVSGLEILKKARTLDPHAMVLVLTGHATIETAVEAMKQGAFDYLIKPFPARDLLAVIDKALRYYDLEQENQRLRQELREKYHFKNLIGTSPAMQAVFRLVERVGPTTSTALILGESGTGKELIARAIHECSPRSEKRFLKINCSALTESLLESELFGHEKGAFTGAAVLKKGLFEAAHGGTLLLDEVGDTPLPLQSKLLRVLQEGEIRRVGGIEDIQVDVRVIAATHQDLKKLIAEGRFRQDLYFRLNVVSIRIPPLRERCADIPLLVDNFLYKKKLHEEREIPHLAPQSLDILKKYSWPGNVRELENAIERALVLSDGAVLEPADFPEEILSQSNANRPESEAWLDSPAIETSLVTLETVEREHITRILIAVAGKREEAARILGITRRTLYDKIKRYGLEEYLP
jgi:two-component system response regulator HydG